MTSILISLYIYLLVGIFLFIGFNFLICYLYKITQDPVIESCYNLWQSYKAQMALQLIFQWPIILIQTVYIIFYRKND